MPLRFKVAALCSILLAAIFVETFFALEKTSRYFAQPGARVFVIEILAACLAYCAGVFVVARNFAPLQGKVLRIASLWGLTGAMLEVVNVAVENGLIFRVRGPAFQIACMLILFATWCVAGTLAAKSTRSIGGGVIAGVTSAGICALAAVAAGCLIEFFAAPPDPAYVATWQEYGRSGWTDPRAFAVANTLDSGFTHLLLAPIVAALLSLAGAAVTRRLQNRKADSAFGSAAS